MSDNMDPLDEKAEEQDRLFSEALTGVLSKFDPEDDSLWNADGKVKMTAVEKAMGEIGMVDATNKITRAEVERVYPEFSRQHQTDMREVAKVADEHAELHKSPDDQVERAYGVDEFRVDMHEASNGGFVSSDRLSDVHTAFLSSIGISAGPNSYAAEYGVEGGGTYDAHVQALALAALVGSGSVFCFDHVSREMNVYEDPNLFWEGFFVLKQREVPLSVVEEGTAKQALHEKDDINVSVHKKDGVAPEALPHPVIGVDKASPDGDHGATCVRRGTKVIATVPIALDQAEGPELGDIVMALPNDMAVVEVVERSTSLFETFADAEKTSAAYLACMRVFALTLIGHPAEYTRHSPDLYDRAANSKLGYIDADIDGVELAAIVHRTPELDVVKIVVYPEDFDPAKYVPIKAEQIEAADCFAKLSGTADNEGPEEDGHTYLPEKFGYGKVNPKSGPMSKHLCDAGEDDEHGMYSAYVAHLEQRVAKLEKLLGVK